MEFYTQDPKTLENIRHCLWPSIQGSDIRIVPDYHCRGKGGKPCKLNTQKACAKYEQFPERFDT